jgi:hypothetical protein
LLHADGRARAQAENIVEIGEIKPMDIDLPGIYVDRIVPATVEKKIEFLTLREEASADDSVPVKKDAARLRREKIACPGGELPPRGCQRVVAIGERDSWDGSIPNQIGS